MRTPAWLGVDVGTSSLKVMAVGADGSPLAEQETAWALDRPDPQTAEADPGVWIRAVDDLVVPMSEAYDVRAVGVTGQMHGTILVDESGTAVRPAVLWPDSRAEVMRPRWDALPGDVLGRLGNPWSAGMTGPVLAWLAEHEPDAVARAERVALPKDLVREHLVPGSTSSDPSDASGTLLWDVAHGSWSREATALVPAHLLPKIRPSVEFVGTWRDAEVVVGGGDTPVSLVALEHAVDGWQPGDVVVNLGTGAQVIDPRTGPPTGSGWSDVHVYEGVLGDHYSMVAAQNAGLALSWAQKQLGITWDELSVICQQAPPGAGGVLFSPFVAPERGALSPTALGTWMDLGGDGQPSADHPGGTCGSRGPGLPGSPLLGAARRGRAQGVRAGWWRTRALGAAAAGRRTRQARQPPAHAQRLGRRGGDPRRWTDTARCPPRQCHVPSRGTFPSSRTPTSAGAPRCTTEACRACHDRGVSQPPPDPGAALPGWAAAALVFGASAAVLVVELVALRLLAPYLGLTMETSTIVIGTALVAIALGALYGGRAADVVAPRRTIAPLLALSGVAVAVTPFLVRATGEPVPPGAALPGGAADDRDPRCTAVGGDADGHQADAHHAQRDRDRRRPALRDRHGRRDLRHRRDRVRADLAGAGDRHHARARAAAADRRRSWSRSAYDGDRRCLPSC